jgi:hypothetical protein
MLTGCAAGFASSEPCSLPRGRLRCTTLYPKPGRGEPANVLGPVKTKPFGRASAVLTGPARVGRIRSRAGARKWAC